MKSIEMGKPGKRLTRLPLKDDGTRAGMGSGKGLRFATEMHIKALSNRTIDMLKTFPGFCEWWFGMDEGQRSFIFEDLHLAVLGKFTHLTGLVEEKAEQMRDCVVDYFDNIPGFTQWKHTVAGADLRGRVQYQLKDNLWEHMRRGYS